MSELKPLWSDGKTYDQITDISEKEGYFSGSAQVVYNLHEDICVLKERLSASPWIPVSERLPEDGQECLYRLTGSGIDKPFGPFHGVFHKAENGFSLKSLGGWMDAADNIEWMEIPE